MTHHQKFVKSIISSLPLRIFIKLIKIKELGAKRYTDPGGKVF